MKTNRNKHLAVQASMRVSQPNDGVTHDVTQTVTHTSVRAASKLRGRSRAPGRYLLRRGTIFYFRKRLPKASPLPGKRISHKSLFCASLQTNVLAEAIARYDPDHVRCSRECGAS